jgi:Ca-activated chloride channel family protein
VDANWNWLSWQWFSPALIKDFHWDNAIILFLVPAVPILFMLRWIFYLPLRPRFDVALHQSEHNRNNYIQFFRLIPVTFKILCLMLALIALARPQSVNEKIEQLVEGIDILLVLDVSESMQLEDLKPNRLEAAKEVARKFIAGRKNDRIGIVIFGGEAYTLTPLTSDLSLVSQQLADVNKSMLEYSGTAIGNAIGTGINRLRDSENKSKVMILLSDGENTSGLLDPITASRLAFGYNIRINTIGIGKEGQVAMGVDSTGRVNYVKSHLDEDALKKIATTTGGQYFRADDNNTLNSIFLQINKIEKGQIRENRFKDTRDYYFVYLYWSLFCLIVWMGLRVTFINNFLED